MRRGLKEASRADRDPDFRRDFFLPVCPGGQEEEEGGGAFLKMGLFFFFFFLPEHELWVVWRRRDKQCATIKAGIPGDS